MADLTDHVVIWNRTNTDDKKCAFCKVLHHDEARYLVNTDKCFSWIGGPGDSISKLNIGGRSRELAHVIGVLRDIGVTEATIRRQVGRLDEFDLAELESENKRIKVLADEIARHCIRYEGDVSVGIIDILVGALEKTAGPKSQEQKRKRT